MKIALNASTDCYVSIYLNPYSAIKAGTADNYVFK
jgi:hypothetical protein